MSGDASTAPRADVVVPTLECDNGIEAASRSHGSSCRCVSDLPVAYCAPVSDLPVAHSALVVDNISNHVNSI